MSIYDLQIDGLSDGLGSYREDYIVVVNIAAECGFSSQLKDLNQLIDHPKFKAHVIAFASNQFNQHHLSDEETQKWAQEKYHVKYPILAKIDVNGAKQHPLYAYIKEHAPGLISTDIKWNFTKFVISPHEKTIKRFAPQTSIQNVEAYILQQIET
jgi:glutathione peroxidase